MAGCSSDSDKFDLDKIAAVWELNPDHVDCLVNDKRLANLIQQLDDYISPRSGVTPRKEKQLETAKEWHKLSKGVYVQNLIVYNESNIILKESQHSEPTDPDSFRVEYHTCSFEADSQGFAALNRALAVAEIRSKRISNTKVIFDLDDQHDVTPTIGESDSDQLKKQLEDRLHEMMSGFAKFYDAITGDVQKDEQKGDILTLQAKIECDKQQRDVRTEYLAEITAKRQSLIVNYWKVMQDSAGVLANLAELFLSYDYDENKLNVLNVKIKALLLKIQHFELEVEMQTYTAKTIKAHQKIRDILNDLLAAAKSKKLFAEEQLSLIGSIGSEFTSLASEYSCIIKTIEDKEWVLKKLQETQ